MTAWNERMIARAIGTQVLDRKCVVLVPNCSWTGHECDVLAVTKDLRVIDVEIKISRSDLKADAKKDKWWHRLSWLRGEQRPPDVRREWPPKVWKHYYAVPREIWDCSLLACLPSEASGVLLMTEQPGRAAPVVASVFRRARPNKNPTTLSAEAVVDIARLANLRMWDAYAQLDARR